MDNNEEKNVNQPGLLKRLVTAARSTDKKQRRAAGNIFYFLALVLALTLIARGTSGATLARVDITAPSRSSIVDAITGTATVSTRDTLDITAPEGLTITEIMTSAGQEVKYGDAIVRFDSGEIQEKLLRETASLDKMFFDLEKLERTEKTDAASLENAQRSLRRVQEDYTNTRQQGEADVAAARDALNTAINKEITQPDPNALDTARKNLLRNQEDYDNTAAQGEADIAAARAALETAKKGSVNYPDYTSVQNAQRSLQRTREDYNVVKAQGETDIAAAQEALDEDPENEVLQKALETAIKRAGDNLLAAKRKVEDAEASLSKAEQDYSKNADQSVESRQTEIDRAQTALDNALKKAEDNLLSARRRVEDAEASLSKAEQDFAKNSDQTTESRQSEIDKAQTALDNAKKKADENLLSARRRVEDAEVSLQKAQTDYSKSIQQTDDTIAQNIISAVSLRLDIDAKKQTVYTLEELLKNDCVIYSDIEGVVLSVASEGSVTGKNPVISFRDSAKGFVAQMQIAKTDADRLALGDECELTTGRGSMYYTPTVTGTITGISQPDDNDRVVITIRLPSGSWIEGQRVDAQTVLSSGNYDLCVPVTALHSDNTGYFLLTVERQSTVLGIQNVVKRVDVSLTASDSDMASVRGPVARDSLVITGSNKTITAGDRVRVNEG